MKVQITDRASMLAVVLLVLALCAAGLVPILICLNLFAYQAKYGGSDPIWTYVLRIADWPSGTLPTLACLTLLFAVSYGDWQLVPGIIRILSLIGRVLIIAGIGAKAITDSLLPFGYVWAGATAALAAATMISSMGFGLIVFIWLLLRVLKSGPIVRPESVDGGKQSGWLGKLVARILMGLWVFVLIQTMMALVKPAANFLAWAYPTGWEPLMLPGINLCLISGLLLIHIGLWRPGGSSMAGLSSPWHRLVITLVGFSALLGYSDAFIFVAYRTTALKLWVLGEFGVFSAMAASISAVIILRELKMFLNPVPSAARPVKRTGRL